MISCRARLVTMDEPSYITMTRRQSNNRQWSDGIAAHPAPKNSEYKNPLEKFSPRFFEFKTASSSLNIFQRAKLSTRNIISAGAIEGHFEGETPRQGHQGGLVLARQCPCSPGTCSPEETALPGLPVSWSPTLFSGSGPVRLPPVPWTEKSIFRPTRRSFLPQRPGWMDNLLNFFLSGLQKLEQQAKKCTELHGEFVE